MTGRLEGKVMLITGAAQGQGRTQAVLCAREGAKVVVTDVLEREGREVAELIQAEGHEAWFAALDVTQEDHWVRVTEKVKDDVGHITVLVNNAGALKRSAIEDLLLADLTHILAVNAIGAALGCKYCIPHMKTAGGGSIINIASTSGLIGSTGGYTAYAMSKGALRLLSRNIAIECAASSIRSNTIFPGPIRTKMIEDMLEPEAWAIRLRSLPLGRVGEPEDVAYAVIYLASDESSFVTGAELAVDGGTTAL